MVIRDIGIVFEESLGRLPDHLDEIGSNFPSHQMRIDVGIAFLAQPRPDFFDVRRVLGELESALDDAWCPVYH